MCRKETLFFQLAVEGYYSIDAEGNVWLEKPRNLVRNFTRRIMSLGNRNGYFIVAFSFQGKRYEIFHHRIVYIHHYGDIPAGMQINHIDGNRANNHISNLEAVTPQENALHAFNVTKTRKDFGENNHNAKLTKRDIAHIYWDRWRLKKTYKEIAREYGIGITSVHNICKLQTWRHLWRMDGKVAGKVEKQALRN
ncbi:MAG: HNH endonuclease signature motif containing protein [Candidatus Latescibacterota bacterium]